MSTAGERDPRSIGSLLREIALIGEKHDEIARARGETFNVFDILGCTRAEQTHSRIIADLLNPEGRHSLEGVFLHHFLCHLADLLTATSLSHPRIKAGIDIVEQLKDKECQACTVKTEVGSKNGRVDILLTDGKGRNIIIENKVYTGEGGEQLARYRTDYPNALLVLLSLDGHESYTKQDGDFVLSLSYKSDIVEWLDQCLKEAAARPLVRETIVQYKAVVADLTEGSRSNKMTEEVMKSILRDERTIRGALEIDDIDVRGEMCKRRIIPELEKIGRGMDLKMENYGFDTFEKCRPLSFFRDDWPHFSITLEFQGGSRTHLIIGIAWKGEKSPNREFIQFLDNKEEYGDREKWNRSNGWPIYRYADGEWKHWQSKEHPIWVNPKEFLDYAKGAISELKELIEEFLKA